MIVVFQLVFAIRDSRISNIRIQPVLLDWRRKNEAATVPGVALRTCSVSCTDLRGCEHTVEVTADSLYEAVAQGLRVFRENDWVDDIGRGQTTISIVVRPPQVEHKVRVQDFERWLESQGRTPAEVGLKRRLRELLRSNVESTATGRAGAEPRRR